MLVLFCVSMCVCILLRPLECAPSTAVLYKMQHDKLSHTDKMASGCQLLCGHSDHIGHDDQTLP